MTGYPPGSLMDLMFTPETVYGEILTTVMTWGGETTRYDPTVDGKPVFHPFPGSRSFGAVTRGPHDVAATVGWKDRVGSHWHDFLALYGWGAADALADHLGDFTMQADVFDGTTHAWHFHNGCKINRADIIFPAPGQAVEFEAEVFSQWLQIVEHASSKAIAGLMQNVTPGADASVETGAVLTWAGNTQINIAAGGLANWHPTNMRLSVVNGIEREYGIKTGDDSIDYSVAIAMHEGVRDILFTAEVLSQNQTYAKSKLAAEAITSLTIPLDTETITLADGEWDEPALTAYAQAVNRESIAIRFKSLST